MKSIILASKSIDRAEILRRAKVSFEVLITNVNEDKYKKEISNPIDLVRKLAEVKALHAKEKLKNANRNLIIIAADTIVELSGEVIGKPKNEGEAFQILKKLSGKTHNLITGIAITNTQSEKIKINYDSTSVRFLDLSDEDIYGYIKTKEWEGRAGAYSIGDKASLFIKSIQGSPSNVIGLPMHKIHEILKNEFDLNLLQLID